MYNMSTETEWIESKAKERLSQNFVKTVLELSGYKVMDYGIENHNQEIIKQIKTNYSPDTNRRLLSMPDYVVVDEESKETWLIEVKYRSFKYYFDMKKSNIAFKYAHMKDYQGFWKDATLILIFNVSPSVNTPHIPGRVSTCTCTTTSKSLFFGTTKHASMYT